MKFLRSGSVNPSDLIDGARQRAGGGVQLRRGRPRQTDLQRAVSDTYYAMFHSLATCRANTLVGTGYSARLQPEWRQIYRALEHGQARRQCGNRETLAQFPPEIQRFGQHFVYTQRLRHQADYDPDSSLTRREVVQLIDETEQIIQTFDRAPAERRRAFAIHVLFRTRTA